jgi:hypothetical protein
LGLGNDEIRSGENDVGIVNCENFFFINYADRGAVSLYFVNFMVNIITAETANIY